MSRESPLPPWLVVAGSVFLLATLTLVVFSIRRDPPPGYPISALEPGPEPTGLTGERLVTIDARDPGRWARLDLSRAALVEDGDPGSWDIAARRFRIVVNGGVGFDGNAGALRLPERTFESVSEAPAEGFVTSQVTAGGDTIHSELDDWYRYGFFSHLLEPEDAVYVIRTADGRYARLEIVGYYCPGANPGCLTLRYVYQGDGSRRLAQ
jgi:hypothetical protein